MWNKIKQFLAPPVFAADEDKTRTAALLNPLILSVFVVDIIGAVATVLVFAQKLGSGIVVGLIFLVLLTAKLFLQYGRARLAGIVFIVGIWLLSSAVIVFSGGRSMIAAAYVSLTVIVGLVLGQGPAIRFAIINSVLSLGLVIAEAVGVTLPLLFPVPLASNWVMLSIALAMAVAPLNLALNSLNAALNRARRYAAEAEQQRQQIEALAEARALELKRRTAYLDAATQIATEIAAVERNPLALLQRAAEVISRQFGFYHTGVFLLDDSGQWAVLQAASGEGGQRMMQRGHRLRVGTEGIVGAVAAYGQYRVVQDVGADGVFFDNPDLPATHSEMALPLRARGEILGVLDVQSTVPTAFTDEDVYVLQALADQISVAVSSARLSRQVEESIAAERRAYGQVVGQAWRDLLRVRPDLAFASDERGVAPFTTWEPQMTAALQTGQVVGAGDDLAIPIRVRDQVIGVIDGHKSAGTAWSEEEIALLQTLTEQLSVALEGAQLYEDTQRRAAREQLAREITAEMRRSLDVTTVLQTALHQLRAALGLTEAEVWIEEASAETSPIPPGPTGRIKGGM
ncbi:MAG TPA: GAF domain-containing protein [Anaerolineae bacterium]|nr:GAF domain-containing protein [Anaerolineae bacterium]HQH37065.1 GAF domain-containing protein [Anaerolineae bacterium]